MATLTAATSTLFASLFICFPVIGAPDNGYYARTNQNWTVGLIRGRKPCWTTWNGPDDRFVSVAWTLKGPQMLVVERLGWSVPEHASIGVRFTPRFAPDLQMSGANNALVFLVDADNPELAQQSLRTLLGVFADTEVTISFQSDEPAWHIPRLDTSILDLGTQKCWKHLEDEAAQGR